MRQFINIINESLFEYDLDDALRHLSEYIVHGSNADLDFLSAAKVLHANGYQEVVKGNRFFRAIFHPLEESDLEGTTADFLQRIKRENWFETGSPQSFTVTLDHAIQFVNATLHVSNYPEEWPIQRPDVPLEQLKHHQVIVVYEVTASPEAILFSMPGALALARHSGGPGAAALVEALAGYDGYGWEDEVILDTRKIKIVDIHLYDSDEHSPH